MFSWSGYSWTDNDQVVRDQTKKRWKRKGLKMRSKIYRLTFYCDWLPATHQHINLVFSARSLSTIPKLGQKFRSDQLTQPSKIRQRLVAFFSNPRQCVLSPATYNRSSRFSPQLTHQKHTMRQQSLQRYITAMEETQHSISSAGKTHNQMGRRGLGHFSDLASKLLRTRAFQWT